MEEDSYLILEDDLSRFNNKSPAFVTFGEVMVRDTPADEERLERTRVVHLSMAGSEYTLAIALSRLGISSAYITRVPDNPYGRAVQNIARENGVITGHMVWAPKTDLMGRFLYEIGRTPRKNVGYYQRKYSAASMLGPGMVDWEKTLRDASLFHTSGITFGLAAHSGYSCNHNLEAFLEAMAAKPEDCRVGIDLNYRSTLWTTEAAKETMTPLLEKHVDVLITTIEDMAKIYKIGCGQYSAKQIQDGDFVVLEDEDIQSFTHTVIDRFNLEILGITIRYPDSFESHRWESATMHKDGSFYRSPAVKPITLTDRLGGGDTWNGGFYYGLITGGFSSTSMEKGILVGDAFTRLKQTLMFDLPIIDKAEVQALLQEDVSGGGKRTLR